MALCFLWRVSLSLSQILALPAHYVATVGLRRKKRKAVEERQQQRQTPGTWTVRFLHCCFWDVKCSVGDVWEGPKYECTAAVLGTVRENYGDACGRRCDVRVLATGRVKAKEAAVPWERLLHVVLAEAASVNIDKLSFPFKRISQKHGASFRNSQKCEWLRQRSGFISSSRGFRVCQTSISLVY